MTNVAADISGVRFCRLVARKRVGKNKHRTYLWECDCDCGGTCISTVGNLRSGNTESCGCLHRERASEAKKTHGLSTTKTYQSWANMVQRCTNDSHPNFDGYGARGISVCQEWMSFENFLADMGEKPSPRHTIERNNVNAGYCKDNCCWIPHAEQPNNTRRNRKLTLNGVTKNLTQWSKELGIKRCTLSDRVHRGWSDEMALTTPVRKHR